MAVTTATAVIALAAAGAAGVRLIGARQLGVVSLAPTRNSGSALGFAPSAPVWGMIAILGTLCCLGFAVRLHERGTAVAIGLLSGGAIANTAERLGMGGALDYVSIGTRHVGVTFNIADVALASGAVLVLRHTTTAHRPSHHHSRREEVTPC